MLLKGAIHSNTVDLWKFISVQRSPTTAESCCSLLRCNVPLWFRHQFVSTEAHQHLSKYVDPTSYTYPTRNFLTVALLNKGG